MLFVIWQKILNIQAYVGEILRDDETLLWHGQSRTDFVFVPYDLIWVPIGLFSLISAAIIALSSKDIVFALMSVGPLVLLATIVFARFSMDLYKRKNTHYLVTDKRIAIKSNTLLDRAVRSVEYSPDFEMTPIDGPKNSTTIYFGPTNSVWDFFCPPNYPLADVYQPPAFAFLDNAVAVMDLINDARRKLCPTR